MTQPEPREEFQWAYRWLDADGNVLDEMDTRANVRETAEERAHRLAANRPPSIPRGDVVRYRVATTAEVVARYPEETGEQPCAGCGCPRKYHDGKNGRCGGVFLCCPCPAYASEESA